MNISQTHPPASAAHRRISLDRIVGQQRVKDVFTAACANGTLGHAYLLCGDEGVGTFAAACELGMALLCESPEDIKPCRICSACTQVLEHAHSDFHVVMPLTIGKEHKKSSGDISEEGWEFIHSRLVNRIADPYATPVSEGLPGIPLEWIREMQQTITRGTVRGRYNVVVLCDVDQLNKESANSFLKTLEEPPAATLLLLLTSHPQAVLPTIISRCQTIRFGVIGDSDLRAALKNRPEAVGLDEDRIEQAVQCSLGSLGTAIGLLSEPLDQQFAVARSLLQLCRDGDWVQIGSFADGLSADRDISALIRLFTVIMYLMRDYIYRSGASGQTYIQDGVAGQNPPLELTVGQISAICTECDVAIAAARSYCTTAAILVHFITQYREIVNGKK